MNTENLMTCPYCMGSGRMKQRCVYCLGSGIRSLDPLVYCDCPMGADLEKAEKHRPPAPQAGLRKLATPDAEIKT